MFKASMRKEGKGVWENKGYWIEIKEPTHFFLPSVFTCIGVPLRDGPRKREPGLTVSLDFQLSVLAELLRETASFLVIVDQLAQLRDVHKSISVFVVGQGSNGCG